MVRNLEHQRHLSLPVAGPSRRQSRRSGSDCRLILDVGRQNVQTIVDAGLQAGDRRGPRLFLASWAAVEVLVTSIVRAAGQMLGQPIAALRQRLRPAVDLLDLSRGQLASRS